MKDQLEEGPLYPGQCCLDGYCWPERGLHNVTPDDETPTSARPHRPTSTEPVDDQQRAHNRLRLIALAESHAHEADRLADNSRAAPLVHALLAHFWLNNAREQS